MNKEFTFLDGINQTKAQVILFLFAPHWIKVPPLSLTYLENFISRYGFKVKIFDLNIFFYNLVEPLGIKTEAPFRAEDNMPSFLRLKPVDLCEGLKLSKNEWLALNSKFENNIFSIIKEKYPSLMNGLISQIANSKAKIIGFSLYSRNRKATINFAKEIFKQNPSKVFVFGGPEILFEYHRKSFFDEINLNNSYFVLGEGELPLLNICKHIYGSNELNSSLYKGKNLITYNEIENLDTLPFLDFDKLDMKLYDTAIIPLFSSRGCIKGCVFCSECKLYKNFRQHSPEYLTELIKFLVKKYNISTFSFHDSMINANLEWLDKFCQILIKENVRIKWEAQLAIRKDMSLDILDKMKKTGCYNLFIGLESGCDKILKLMHKGYDAKQARDFLAKISTANLQYEISLIVGFPQENEDDFKQTVKFLKENKRNIPKIAQVNPFVEYSPSQINTKEAKLNLVAKERINSLLQMFKGEKIRYTPSFINNLTRHED